MFGFCFEVYLFPIKLAFNGFGFFSEHGFESLIWEKGMNVHILRLDGFFGKVEEDAGKGGNFPHDSLIIHNEVIVHALLRV